MPRNDIVASFLPFHPTNPFNSVSPSTSLTHHHIITSRHSHAYIHVVCTHKDPPKILIPLIDPCTSPAALRSTPIIPTVHPYIHPPIVHPSIIHPSIPHKHPCKLYVPAQHHCKRRPPPESFPDTPSSPRFFFPLPSGRSWAG